MKKRIISLLTIMTIITAMIQMPVFAAEEIVSENISNDQLEGDLYLPSDEEAGEFKLEDEYIENEPNEDMSASQLDNVNYESTADIDNSSDIELMSIVASGNCGAKSSNITWVLDSNGKFTISGNGEMENYGFSSAAAPWYSDRNDIKNVVISGNITNIGNFVFNDCTNLASVSIPSSVTSIGEYAFSSCSSLPSISIPDSVTSIGEYAFSECSSLVRVAMPSHLISIADHAFERCENLTNITIPNNVTHIGVNAFCACHRLTNITIPSNVESLGANPFSGCGSLNISVSANNSHYRDIDGVLFDKEGTRIIAYAKDKIQPYYEIPTDITNIVRGAFSGCGSLINITIPNGIKIIPWDAFSGCASLKEIAIPSTVTKIESYSFNGCKSLTNVVIPNGVTTINMASFAYCDRLTSITIPNSVTSIGVSAFSGCSSLTEIYYSGIETEWNNIDIGPYNENLINSTIHYRTGYVVSTPTISTSNIIGGKSVSISCSTSGATIYYTTNGSTPTTSSNRYNGAISLTSVGTTTIKAIAVKSGYNNSSVVTRDVTVSRAATPAASPSGGTITSPTSVTLSCSTSGATIYYTTNGNTPTTSSTRYTGAINISSTTTLKAIAVASGYANSSTATYTYTYSQPTTSKRFTMLRDNYSFVNTQSSFGYSQTYSIPVERYIEVFGETRGRQAYNAEKYDPKYPNSTGWLGSCYGFSASSLMFFMDKIDYTQFNKTAKSLYDIPAPKNSKNALTKLIEKYQLVQSLTSISANKQSHRNDYDGLIDAVTNFVQNGTDPIIISVRALNYGHAVVPYDIQQTASGEYRIYVYDNNYPTSKSQYITVNRNKKHFLINHTIMQYFILMHRWCMIH